MDKMNTAVRMLALIDRPAFIVAEGRILHANTHAQALHICNETALDSLLGKHKPIYDDFTAGTLQIPLQVNESKLQAYVEKMEGFDLFTIESPHQDARLTALAMASSQLRIPLTGLMSSMDENTPQVNRMLYQLHRAVSNMSDALRYSSPRNPQLQIVDICSWLAEMVESVSAHAESLGIDFTYKPLNAPLYCPIEEELLRRALLNLISNSIKAGSTQLELRLSKQSKTVSLTLSDNGKGVDQNIRADIFTQYRQQPELGHLNYGLGLGMVIVKAAADTHKGTVLLKHMPDGGLQTTLTLSTQSQENMLRTPIMRMDYLGGRDPVLTELSDVLPVSEY